MSCEILNLTTQAWLHAGDFSDTLVQGRLVHDMRYLASVVTQCFTAFGELLGMHKRLAELSGGITRVSEMMDTMRTAAEQEATLRLTDTASSALPPRTHTFRHPHIHLPIYLNPSYSTRTRKNCY